MADFKHRYTENVPGKFYTDILCLDCTVCREIAPMIFARDDVHHTAYVFHQPDTPEELVLCEDSLRRCPCEAIGDDGDVHEWSEPPDPIYYRDRREASDRKSRSEP